LKLCDTVEHGKIEMKVWHCKNVGSVDETYFYCRFNSY